MKKLLTLLSVCSLGVVASSSVVACTNQETEAKTDLGSIVTNTEIDGSKFNTEKEVLEQIIVLNEKITAQDVEIENFKPASETAGGSAELHAKSDSKFVGKVDIKITAKKIALDSEIKITTVDGNKFNEAKYVLTEIINLNKYSGVTEADVEIKDFKPASAPSEGKEGSAVLHAKSDSKFVGKVDIKITAKSKVALDSEIKITTVDGNKFNNEAAVLLEVINNLNKDSNVSTTDVEIKNFVPSLAGVPGSAELHAKSSSNFTGKVNITITLINSEELENIIKKIGDANSKEKYGKEFADAYKEYILFLQKIMVKQFEVNPWVLKNEPSNLTDVEKRSIFDAVEEYIRSIRRAHFKIGLVSVNIYIDFQPSELQINSIEKSLDFDIKQAWLHDNDEKNPIKDSIFSIKASVKYKVEN